MTILIVEGPDLSGKTYAIEKIAKHFNSGFILKNTFKPKKLKDTAKIYNQYWSLLKLVAHYQVAKTDELIILDRFYPSQAVYSYLRGRDDLEDPSILTLEDFCKKLGVKMIYLETDLQELETRYEIRGDEYIKKEQLRKLKERYDLFMSNTKLPMLKVNTLREHWLEKIERFLK